MIINPRPDSAARSNYFLRTQSLSAEGHEVGVGIIPKSVKWLAPRQDITAELFGLGGGFRVGHEDVIGQRCNELLASPRQHLPNYCGNWSQKFDQSARLVRERQQEINTARALRISAKRISSAQLCGKQKGSRFTSVDSIGARRLREVW